VGKGAGRRRTAGRRKAAATGTRQRAAAVTKRIPPVAIDAISLLENDHRELQRLLARGEETSRRAPKQRKVLLDTLASKLAVHETIEERALYPALEVHPEARAVVLEGFQEHHGADLIVKELYDTATTAQEWAAKFKVLKENLEHHIDEEEGDMFRTARAVMTQAQLVELGARMARMKADAARGRM
jgi:hypothetical protein